MQAKRIHVDGVIAAGICGDIARGHDGVEILGGGDFPAHGDFCLWCGNARPQHHRVGDGIARCHTVGKRRRGQLRLWPIGQSSGDIAGGKHGRSCGAGSRASGVDNLSSRNLSHIDMMCHLYKPCNRTSGSSCVISVALTCWGSSTRNVRCLPR